MQCPIFYKFDPSCPTRYQKILGGVSLERKKLVNYHLPQSHYEIPQKSITKKLITIHMKDRDWPVGEERLRKLWLWWRLWCNLRARPVSSLADNDVPEFFGDRMFPVVAETEIALVLEHPAEDADFLRVVFRTDSSKSKIRIRFFSSGCHSIQSL